MSTVGTKDSPQVGLSLDSQVSRKNKTTGKTMDNESFLPRRHLSPFQTEIATSVTDLRASKRRR